MPRYITGFDVIVNALAYLPAGALVGLALHPRVRGAWAAIIATLAGVLLSASLEALQTFLPSRIASSIDLASNSAGALLGALLAARYAPGLIDRGRLAQLRARWFHRDASVPLALLALWPLAQVHPGPMLFGNGDLRDTLSALFDALGGVPVWLVPGEFGAAEFVLAEVAATATGVLGAGLAAAATMPSFAPRARLLLALVGSALAIKALASGIQFGPDRVFAWMTPGAIGGLALGISALLAAATGRPRAMARVALLAIITLIAVVNLTPENPYHVHWIGQWRPGRLVHIADAADWLATAWPFVLLFWLAPAAFSSRLRPPALRVP
jgi:VanZ family protein